jgi:hypothetical protein
VALAVTPGRDPDETPDDRLYANIATGALIVVAIAFVVWLIWVQPTGFHVRHHGHLTRSTF